jgi:hypothetical protein
VPERVGLKVLPISTKSRFLLRERPETVGEEQEPPCLYAGEASEIRERRVYQYGIGESWWFRKQLEWSNHKQSTCLPSG